MTVETDILVDGGGVGGLAATVAFADAGFSTLCVDPVPPVTTLDDPDADLRTTAYLQPGRDFLDQIGLWAHVAEDAQGLRTMRIVDLGAPDAPPRDFVSDEISERLLRPTKNSDRSDLRSDCGYLAPNLPSC